MKPVEEPFGGLGQLAAIVRCCRARRDHCAPRSNPETAVLHPEQALNLMPLRRSKQAIGNCHLCGTVGPLTFEHIPPKAAFNDCRVLEADIYRLIGSNLIDELNGPKGKYNQKGAGGYTLCSSCNDNTGSWYGHSYIEFIKQAYGYLYSIKQDIEYLLRFK